MRKREWFEDARTVRRSYRTPKKPFVLTKPVQVLVYGTGPAALQDSDGRVIDGDHNGVAGGNAVAIIAKKGVAIDAEVSARVEAKEPRSRTAIIDALLARGDLADLKEALRAQNHSHLAHARP